jgi:hypothetical protein
MDGQRGNFVSSAATMSSYFSFFSNFNEAEFMQ